jgi:transcriptional regulator GlxA family with amidase domain
MEQKIVGIFLFNEVEVLDFAGPFEVFSVTEVNGKKPFNVVTISEDGKQIKARNGLTIVPDYSFTDHPPLDILVVPGGYGARKIEINNQRTLDWIKEQHNHVSITTSVCTGAFLLAKIGLLDNKAATTHYESLELLAKTFPLIEVKKGIKFVDEGQLVTSAGISAGIEMSLYLVGKILGEKVARETAQHMEYNR